MSWKDRLENKKLRITTGDGKVYEPLWILAEKYKEFNTSRYDFINVDGSFVDRKKPQGGKFPLVFYFQGEDNIEQSQAFEDSANDSRLWTVEHPFYGTIKGQPTNLRRNDNSYNITEITTEFWESITDDFPLSKISPRDEVLSRVNVLNLAAVNMFTENSAPSTSDISDVKNNVIISGSKFSPDADSFNDYSNTVAKAVRSADKLVTDTEQTIKDIQEVINAPANFSDTVSKKISYYVEAYDILKENISNLFSKYYFESQGSSIIAGICSCAINPGNNYITRNDIESVNESLNNIYNDYLTTLDENQVEIYDIENSWTPTSVIQSNLSGLVSFTSNSLFLLSFDARQERIFEVTEDTNLILLSHRFLGPDRTDEKLENFRIINDIRNDELFLIRKGRMIKYFV